MKRRNLVVVRAGDNSLHPSWLEGGPRNWDLVVNYYGDDPLRYTDAGEGVVRIDSKGPKWPALGRLMTETRSAWSAYDFIWLPDDDLAASGADINRMFDAMPALGLHLAQPSLSWQSHWSLALTLHNPNFALRYSSFVEPMAPMFSRALLERVLPTFSEIISGWGLDYVWPRHLDEPATQCAVIDGIQVTHTRPVGGPNYQFNKGAGVNPRAEMMALLKKHGIPEPLQLSYGGIDLQGQPHNLFGDDGGEFIYRVCDGYRRLFADKPQLIGAIFERLASARDEVLAAGAAAPAPAPAATVAEAPIEAASALQRFRAAAEAARRDPAGRVLAGAVAP